ncbi:aldose 1-epimerase family protein [Nonomuraea soli]|uniref:Aldose 1-epimerase n=1 Tax=Nonomuraea soli TaxID=1032476 RepID=A0A7W0CG66_9ACTN|nr:aldose 1-epimerase family protein [Nonomuraea soli]MBA2890553.1 aldose 1-epimerase [Nonomuraea soli]
MPTLRSGSLLADVSARGAAVRVLRDGERDLVTSWPADGPIPYYSGTVLAPWPNRVAGARYVFDGEEHRLPVNEPDRGHALHGLVAEAEWTVAEFLQVEDDHAFVRLTLALEPSPGYPFSLGLEIVHRLGSGGLTSTLTARNTGDRPAPYGCGPHPWLLSDVDELHLPASQVLLVDEALVPRELTGVETTPYDFREPRKVGDTAIDHAFTGLSEGRVRHGCVEIVWDAAVMPWVQVCTGTGLGHAGLAVEPMTCPPDAFNSGTGLIRLAPGRSHEASWTIRTVSAAG